MTGPCPTTYCACCFGWLQHVHPFQFLRGEFTDELYELEVRACAQGFVGDSCLKAKVKEVASMMFEQLKGVETDQMLPPAEFDYRGVRMTVVCGKQGTARAATAVGGGSSSSSGSSHDVHG